MKAVVAELKGLAQIADWHAAAAFLEATSEWAPGKSATARGLAWTRA